MIALIGYMGSGKTTLSKILAQKMNVPVYETDKIVFEIARVNSMQEVFDAGGEEHLRTLELAAIKSLYQEPDGIIDCGGGVITNQVSLVALQEIAEDIIFLRVPFDLALERVGNDKNRPLFSDKLNAKRIYNNRRKLYETAATDVVDVHGQTADELAEEVLERIL